MDYMKMYNKWLTFGDDVKKELSNLGDEEIKDRFYRELEFGTGGLRGIIGFGTNRMNIYTVRKATLGLANYIMKNSEKNASVAIAYDSRKYSDIFAREAALVLNAKGIKTYIYKELKPTPMLSFAVRNLKASAGIVITASHNPKEYNGYKVYWNDGGQITEEHAAGILNEINKVHYENIEFMDYNDAVKKGFYNFIPDSVGDEYIKLVKKLSINKEAIDYGKDNLKVIYTPLHGTGNKPVRRVLRELGYKNIEVVKEQELPDSNFSTVKYPNPEEPEVFKIALKMAKNEDVDLIIGTDPDCDRVGIVVKDKDGNFGVLTGNQTGTLLTYYVLSQLKELGKMPDNPFVVKTIVTTEIARRICDDFGVEIIDVLTGFKYIGEKIKENEGKKNFIIGFEESYGYLLGNFVRDKDAVIASSLICEMAAYYKKKGLSLYDALINIYEKYGYYREGLKSLTMKGIEGTQKINSIMENLRINTPKELCGIKVIKVKDYLSKIERDIIHNNEKNIELPKSNVIQLCFEDGSLVTARPSGTEPKIKFYFACCGKSLRDAEEKVDKLEEALMKVVE